MGNFDWDSFEGAPRLQLIRISGSSGNAEEAVIGFAIVDVFAAF